MDRFSAGARFAALFALSACVALACESEQRNFGVNDAGVGPESANPSSEGDASAGVAASGSGSDASVPADPSGPATEPGEPSAEGSGGEGAIGTGGDNAGPSQGGAAGNGSSGGASSGSGGTNTGGTGGQSTDGNGGSAGGGGAGGNPSVALCGNGVLEPGEDCDEGADNSNSETCNPTCLLDPCSEGETRSCEDGGLLGDCAMGTQACAGGFFGPCSIEAATEDSCEAGDDADCDGTANEGCACMAGTMQSCSVVGEMGNCAMGTVTCDEDGMYGPCSIQPLGADSCATVGDDADCDGNPNENCECENGDTQPCGPPSDVGACTFGTSTCQAGAWGACVGAVYPAPRDCRSTQDLDCNGTADNTIDATCQCVPNTSEQCGAHPGQDGNGACTAGSRTCVAGTGNTTSAWGACVGSVGPSAATDSCATAGNDNNCDGTENGGCTCIAGQTTTCGAEYDYTGECADYTLTCAQNGAWPSAATGCAAQGSDTCAPPGECLGAVWSDDSTPWGTACWQ